MIRSIYRNSLNSKKILVNKRSLNIKKISLQRIHQEFVKPFESIPGPKPLPIIGNLWRYFPYIGEFTMTRMHRNAQKLLNQYGNLVREVVVGKRVVLHIFRPEDAEHVLRHEGRSPMRLSHRALLKYRLERPEVYKSGGLFPTNGEDWYRLRSLVQKPMMQPGGQESFVHHLDQISADLIENRIQNLRKHKENDFQKDLYKWALECTGQISLDKRLGCLETDLKANSEAIRLIKAAGKTHYAVMITENGLPFWQYFPTASYRDLVQAQDVMSQIIGKHLECSETRKNKENERSLLETFRNTEGLDKNDIFTMVLDMFLAGIDTTAYATAFTLYHLTQNLDKQEKLHLELVKLLPTAKSPVTSSTLKSAFFLKACIKESMRLHPISIGIGRLLTSEIVLGGYNIPKNTMIITHHQVACRQPENFQEPNLFIPERWLKGNPKEEKAHPFLVLPFGYGSRSCVGKRFAELEMFILLAKIFRRYQVSYNGEIIDSFTRLINVPDQELKLGFEEIN